MDCTRLRSLHTSPRSMARGSSALGSGNRPSDHSLPKVSTAFALSSSRPANCWMVWCSHWVSEGSWRWLKVWAGKAKPVARPRPLATIGCSSRLRLSSESGTACTRLALRFHQPAKERLATAANAVAKPCTPGLQPAVSSQPRPTPASISRAVAPAASHSARRALPGNVGSAALIRPKTAAGWLLSAPFSASSSGAVPGSPQNMASSREAP